MDPILQQLQQYYQQQQRVGQQLSPSAQYSTTTAVFNPWWLKLRQNLQKPTPSATQKSVSQFMRAHN